MATAGAIRAGRAFVELFTDNTKLVRGLRAAKAKITAFGRDVGNVGRAMMRVAAVAAAPFAVGAKAFATFDKQMRMVSTMLGDQATVWMPMFSDAAKKMSVEFGQSIEHIAKGMYDLLSAQVPPAEMLGVLRVAMKAATGGMTDTATAVKAVVRVMRGFGLDASKAGHITDTLAMIVEKGVITFEELAETVGTVAPTAKAAGLNLEQLAAAIATVVSVEEPARAMTALRTAIFEAAEAGMDLMAFARKYKGADLGTIIKAGIPKKAAQGIVILAQNMDLLDKNLVAMTNSAGAADEKYKKMAGGLSHSFDQIKSAAWVAMIDVGEAIQKPLEWVAELAKTWGESISKMIRKNSGWISSIAQIIAGIFALGAALFIFSGILKAVSFSIGIIIVAFKAMVFVLGLLKVAVLAMVAIFGLLLSPIGLVVVAVGAMGAGIIIATKAGGDALEWLSKKFAKLRDWAVDMWTGISDALATGNLALAAEIAWLGIQVAWLNGINYLQVAWSDFSSWFETTWIKASKGVAAAALWAAEKIGNVWGEAIAGYKIAAIAAKRLATIAAIKLNPNITNKEAAIEEASALAEKEKMAVESGVEKQRAASDEFFDKLKKSVEASYQADLKRIAEDKTKNKKTMDAEIAAANAKYQAAIAKAAAERKKFEADLDKPPAMPDMPKVPTGKDVSSGSSAAGKALKAAVNITRGTFLGERIGGMAGGVDARKIKAAEEAARRLKNIDKKMRVARFAP